MTEAELVKTILGLGLGHFPLAVLVIIAIFAYRFFVWRQKIETQKLAIEEQKLALDKERTACIIDAVKSIHERLDEHGEKLHAKVDRVIDKIDDKRIEGLTEVVRRLGPDESGSHTPPASQVPLRKGR